MVQARLVLALAFLVSASNLAAEITGVDLSCTADRYGSNLNCTANEFGVTTDLTVVPGSECDLGQTVTLNTVAQIEGGNSARYDIALYIGQNGNDPRDLNTGELCSVTIGPTSGAGTFWIDADSDVAGDYDPNATTVPPNTSPMFLNGIKMNCQADASGNLGIPFVLSYSQSSVNDITGPDDLDLIPGTPSKCSSGFFSATGMTFFGHVDVVKSTDPGGAAQSFDFSASTTAGVSVTPSAFALSDGQTQRLRMPVVSAARQLVITESALPGWQLASINCTPTAGSGAVTTTVDLVNRSVTVDLTLSAFGASCVFSNETLEADLAITKTDSAASYTPGNTGVFVITASNNGPNDVTAASVTDTFPAGVTLGGPWTCVAAGGASCGAISGGSINDTMFTDNPDIPTGASVTYTVPVMYSADEADY